MILVGLFQLGIINDSLIYGCDSSVLVCSETSCPGWSVSERVKRYQALACSGFISYELDKFAACGVFGAFFFLVIGEGFLYL